MADSDTGKQPEEDGGQSARLSPTISQDAADGRPEPPSGYRGETGQVGLPHFETTERVPDDLAEFQSARRMVTAAQIMALVSLFIGGAVLSIAALVVSIVSYVKATRGLRSASDEGLPHWQTAKRLALVAIVASAFALTANIVTLIVFYPTLVEMLQSGDYSTMLESGSSSQPNAGSSSSIWG